MRFLFLLLAFATAPLVTQAQELQSGDIIFQTSKWQEPDPIRIATGSHYTHTGVVEVVGDKKYVIEGAGVKKPTPFADFIARGEGRSYAVFRYGSGLTVDQKKKVIAAAKSYLGKPYDGLFHFHNSAIYCSELVWFAYRDAGVPLGRVQKIGELNVHNKAVQDIFLARWKEHPLCKTGKARTAEQCWGFVLADDIITPMSIAADAYLTPVVSTYR